MPAAKKAAVRKTAAKKAGTPTRYAALLRGVNVGGNKKIAMADLRTLLIGLGHEDVSTLLQSGNAVFTAPAADARTLAATIERALATELGLTSKVLLRTHRELVAIIEANPFPSADEEPSKHLVQFLFEPLTAADREKIKSFDAASYEPEEFRVGNGVLYFRFPDGMGRSTLAADFGKHVTKKLVMTGRNWNTVRKLCDLSG
jgi:uncharacterized protein (DUF1697 family)